MTGKISVIGAGNVGATCAQRLFERRLADIVMVDIIDGLPQGKALDMSQSAPILGVDRRISGTNSYQDTANSDVVVITSGLARKPGMSRDDLIKANMNIIGDVVRSVVSHSPDCVIVMVTNPVDAMTQLAIKTSGFPRNRVMGLSGVLDSARLRSFIAAELNVSVENVSVCVLGQHGQNMVVIPRFCTVGGVPITRLLPKEAVDRLVERTVNGGAEIVGLLKTGSAFYAPSAAAAQMAEAVILDKRQILPCAVYLDGEYGIWDTVLGVPAKIGRGGIMEIIELELTCEEMQAVAGAAQIVRGLVRVMNL
jgi:malate dehydrogenase